MSACTADCWTPVPCPEHGDRMTPFGRSAGLDEHQCCENYSKPDINRRHLWDEHDSTRWYTDPQGWQEHETTCPKCTEES